MRVPGSKSISNRALLLAGFAAGTTVIEGAARLRRHPGHARRAGAARLRHRGGAAPARRAPASAAGRRCSSATFFLGNAGTAMRPLTAALALVRRVVRRALRAARHAAHARAADRRPGRRPARARLRRSTTWAAKAIRRCASRPAPAPLAFDRADPGARRRLQPVPDRPAARPAAARRAGRRGDRGRRRADLQALRRDHAEACSSASASPSSARAGSASRLGAGQPLRSPGRFVVEGDASSASYFIAAGGDRARSTRRCASKASAATRSRATSPSSTRRGRWARRIDAGPRLARGAPRPLAAGGRSTSTATTFPTRR